MVSEAAELLRHTLGEDHEALLVLGSGLGSLVEQVEGGAELPFDRIPGLPGAGVAGHRGRYVAGRLWGRRVLVQAGRLHHYEGHDPGLVVAPVTIARMLGVRIAIYTNAAGGIDPRLEPGSIMLVRDHLDLQGRRAPMPSPDSGPRRAFEPSSPYDPRLQAVAREVAERTGLLLVSGIYAAVLGPSYETPAEIRALRAAGADAVGMSTVPEVLAARREGLHVLALSLITNRAAGLGVDRLSHDEVLEAGRAGSGKVIRVIEGVLERIDGLESEG